MVELMVYYWKEKKKLQITNCCPIYIEKSYPGKRAGHPPSRVTSDNRLQEKNVDPLKEPTAIAHALIVSRLDRANQRANREP